jgi:hypothetical protein
MGTFSSCTGPAKEKLMKTSIITVNRFGFIAGVTATLAIAAMAYAGGAQARDSLSFSVGIASPGVQFGVTHAYPVYSQPQPIYVQARPVYVQPRLVYVQPAPAYTPSPVYYAQPPVYVAPQPAYHPRAYKKRHRDHDRYQGYQAYQGYQGYQGYQSYQPAPPLVYTPRPTYAPVYYQR